MNNKLNELKFYQNAMDIGEKIWVLVSELHNFSKYSQGKQVVESADSIAANFSEGYGRFHFKDSVKFY